MFVHINKTGGSSIEKALRLPHEHVTALELRERLGTDRWRRRFSFAFVRNPWSKVHSHYKYRRRMGRLGPEDEAPSFPEWVRLAYGDHDPRYYDEPLMFGPQMHWIGDGSGEVLVDFVGRFERLEEDFQEVCRRIGRTATLPHLKPSPGGSYVTAYDDATRALVGDLFRADLELFGYAFDASPAR